MFCTCFRIFIFNSLFVTIVNVALTVLVSTMAAYGLVKHHPKGSNLIFSIILIALTFPSQATQISNYIVVRGLGLLDTYASLIIPSIAGIITTFWFMAGGIIDLRRLFRDLAKRVDNPLDNGQVVGHVSVTDRQQMGEAEEAE